MSPIPHEKVDTDSCSPIENYQSTILGTTFGTEKKSKTTIGFFIHQSLILRDVFHIIL